MQGNYLPLTMIREAYLAAADMAVVPSGALRLCPVLASEPQGRFAVIFISFQPWSRRAIGFNA
jgi:hypothetical protein